MLTILVPGRKCTYSVPFNPLDLKSARAGRLFTPQVGQARPYILVSWFDLFQRRPLGDTFETHLTCRVNILAMHCGYLWIPVLFKFTEFEANFQSAHFCVTKMVSAKVFAIQAVSRLEYVTLVDVSL